MDPTLESLRADLGPNPTPERWGQAVASALAADPGPRTLLRLSDLLRAEAETVPATGEGGRWHLYAALQRMDLEMTLMGQSCTSSASGIRT